MIKDSNYYVVHGWMRNELKLKGVELEIYAIIYGFSQDGDSWYAGTLQYIMEWTDKSKKTCIEALKALCEKGYIEKWDEEVANHITQPKYRAVVPHETGVKITPPVKKTEETGVKITPPVKKTEETGVKITPPRCKNYTAPGVKITPNNNIYINNNINNTDNISLDETKDPETGTLGKAILNQIIDAWNSTGLNKVMRINERSDRMKLLKARINENGLDEVIRVIGTIPECPYLLGKVNGWQADFDWFVKPNNFTKVQEGKYLDKKRPGEVTSSNGRSYCQNDDDALNDELMRMFANG